MQKSYTLFLLTMLSIPSLLQSAFTGSKAEGDEMDSISNSQFAKKPGTLGIFSYSEGKEIAPVSSALFTQADFNDWKRTCDAGANNWIYKGQGKSDEKKEYEMCKNLTSELTLALKIIYDNKYKLTNDIAAIRETLEPVVQAAKRVKGSLFKRFKGNFKSETPSRNIINTIKSVLDSRVKELFDDFNEKLKKSGKKDIKKISL